MKYVVIIGDNGGILTYYEAKPFNINILDNAFCKNYREVDNENLLKDIERQFHYVNSSEKELYKVYAHVNNLNHNAILVIGFTQPFSFNIVNTKEIYKPEPKYIFINYDFISGKELPYSQANVCQEEFETNCLSLFNFDNLAEYSDIIVRKHNGDYISAVELLNNEHKYCMQQIRIEHNICKMLIANSFEFRKGVM